ARLLADLAPGPGAEPGRPGLLPRVRLRRGRPVPRLLRPPAGRRGPDDPRRRPPPGRRPGPAVSEAASQAPPAGDGRGRGAVMRAAGRRAGGCWRMARTSAVATNAMAAAEWKATV